MNDVRTMMRVAASVILVVSLLAPAVASGQGRTFGRVVASAEHFYESNLFGVAETFQPQSDWITRIGPTVEAGYRSIPLKLLVRYGFDADHHQRLPDLDRLFARQDLTSTLNYRKPRFSLDVNGSFIDTHTPTELNLETLRLLGRARARRLELGPTAAVNLSPVTTIHLDHAFSRERLVGGIGSVTQISRIGIARKVDARNTLRSDYRLGHMGFSDGGEELSQAATGGWVHQFTPLLNIAVDAGARLTAGTLEPELSALLSRQLRHGGITVRYVRTRETTIGESGSIEVQRLSAELSVTPTRSLTITATPSRARSVGSMSRDVVNVLDVESRIRATPRWSLAVVARLARQTRTVAAVDVIPYQRVSFQSIVTLGDVEREQPKEPERDRP